MDISLPDRVDVISFVLGAALVAMSVSALGALLGLGAWPLMRAIETHVNPMVTAAATLLNAVTVWLVLLALRWASARGHVRPTSIFAGNATVFACARIVALVYLAELVVGLVASEIRWFLQVPFFNATQLNVLSAQGRVFTTIVLPLTGVALLIAFTPRLFGRHSNRAT